MKAFLAYLLSLVAFAVTGAVGCHAKSQWLAFCCTLGCCAWTAFMIYALYIWLIR